MRKDYIVVPREPTDEMLAAIPPVLKSLCKIMAVWRAMVKTAEKMDISLPEDWRPISECPSKKYIGIFWLVPDVGADGLLTTTGGKKHLVTVAPHSFIGKRNTWSSVLKATHYRPPMMPPSDV